MISEVIGRFKMIGIFVKKDRKLTPKSENTSNRPQ